MIKKNINIEIDNVTRMVYFDDNFLGVGAENLQGNIIFTFTGDFITGTPRVEVEKADNKYIISEITQSGSTYVMPIKSSLLTESNMIMQLVITEGTGSTDIPVFKSKEFMVKVAESVNATATIPEEYETWINLANTKLNQMDNFDISVTKSGDTATISLTNRLGTTTTATISDGEDGEAGAKGDKGDTGDAGADATINGVNALTLNTTGVITGTQSGSTYTIGANLSNYATTTQLNTKQDTITSSTDLSINELTTADDLTVNGDETTINGKLFVNHGAVEMTGGTVTIGSTNIGYAQAETLYYRENGTTEPAEYTNVKTAIDNKVTAVSGKGLSTNDYTNTEKTKLAGIEDSANNYTLPASSQTALGGLKVRYDSTTGILYIRNDGSDA